MQCPFCKNYFAVVQQHLAEVQQDERSPAKAEASGSIPEGESFTGNGAG